MNETAERSMAGDGPLIRGAERTQARNALRALLCSLGIKPPRNLWSRRGMAWLAGLQVAGDLRQERIRTLTEMAFSGDAGRR